VFLSSDTSGVIEVLYLLLVGLALLAVLRCRDRPGAPSAVAAGVAIGLAALTRTEGLLLVAFVVGPGLWGRGAGRRWALPLVATLAALAVIAPWTAHNWHVFGRPVLISTNGATVAAGANCPPAYHGSATGTWVPACMERAAPDTADIAHYDEMRAAREWQSTGSTYARDHLGRLAAVVAPVRVLRTWNLWQPLGQVSLQEGQNRRVAKVGVLFFLLVLAPAGLLGAAFGGLRRDHLLLLAALGAMVTVTSAAGWGSPRFLRPAELALLVAAGALAEAGLRRRGLSRTG
jgi:4-amino-4-deoxy-L-arabinose transferase-like glycosyltransferase